MKILEHPMTLDELKTMAETLFGDMVKAVVDVDAGLLALDAELHADLESLLIEKGSAQNTLWGINLYPDMDDDFIEFDSMINMRPSQGNMSRGVDNEAIKQKIIAIVTKWVKR